MQRYNIISIYARQLTLIKFFLYFYTFSQHTHTRVHYTRQSTNRLTHQYRQKAYVCVCIDRMVVFFTSAASESIQKPKKQIKPIHGTKILQGRVALPLWRCAFRGLPHLIFFLIFFDANSFLIFFLIFCFLFVIC